MKTKKDATNTRGSGREDADRRARKPRRGEQQRGDGGPGGRARPAQRRAAEPVPRGNRPRKGKAGKVAGPSRQPQAVRRAPVTTPERKRVPAKNASQAKARAKARKAKAPKVVRPPLKERLLTRLSAIDLSPRKLAARVPFVVLVIAALGLGLGVTLWLSTDAAERSYQLGNIRQTNNALMQQKEALERQVLEAQAAPALAEAARNLGMIPSKDTAHLVLDPAGNWVVVGTPKPAEGVPPPPLNTKLPDDPPPAAPPNPERPVRLGVPAPGAATVPGAAPEVPVRVIPGTDIPLNHAPAGPTAGIGPMQLPAGPAPGPVATAPGTTPGPAVPGAAVPPGAAPPVLAPVPAAPAAPLALTHLLRGP
ncbi:hypothetical protein, partial [Mycolicibacterium palauense]|uniref:hypothetical protein n=1 Tax=Mycolicibacterium palauense TaxID=2034511 RepID=UPI001FEA9CF4